ncbi:MAG TPA: FecR domain-containing protein [Prolixibacteraceae bacterium]|nr:FecR domain-containing protein [Prolixibacteraceae bacterium]
METYRDYKAVDFLNDESFLHWLTDPTQKENDFWNEFLKNHPYKKAEIKEAKLVFTLLHSNEEKLGMNETYEIWNRIQKEAKTSKRAVFMNFMKYAAILVLVFFSGVVTYYFYQSTEETYQFQLAETPKMEKDEAMIILSDGSQVSLEKRMSQISYSKNGQRLIVNNDTINQKAESEKEMINKVIIPYGKKSMIMLSDGTRVWLNAGSQLIYPSVFADKVRQVMLVGEAFFDVVKNPEKPFVVRTIDVSVHVLGTRFDISAYPEDKLVQTVLEEGAVSLNCSGKGILNKSYVVKMIPNQMVLLNKSTGESKSQMVDVSKYVSWKDGMLEFDKVDLVRALKQVERYYNVKISLADPLIGSYKLSGKLDLKDNIEEVLNVIKLTVPIDWQKKSNGDFLIFNKRNNN